MIEINHEDRNLSNHKQARKTEAYEKQIARSPQRTKPNIQTLLIWSYPPHSPEQANIPAPEKKNQTIGQYCNDGDKKVE